MRVPFLDVHAVNLRSRSHFNQALNNILDTGWLIQGHHLQDFEKRFAEFTGVNYCIGVGNGLDALELLLVAHDIGLGDEVLVPSNTFIATWLAVTRCGAKPIPVEPDPLTFNISPKKIEECITERTAAIICVHLYGQPADIDSINAIAKKYDIPVFEDAAQAHGALYKNKSVGCLTDGGATSFYPGKNLGALGDGGAVLTNSENIANKIKKLRNYGSVIKYEHEVQGCNSRLDELQAAFLNIKLSLLKDDNAARAQIAEQYLRGITNPNVILPYVPEWAQPVWHLYVIRSKSREALRAYLHDLGVETMIHYPIPPHKQKCYSNYNYPELDLTESIADEVLSIPISPVLTVTDVDYVINAINSFTL
jgi:dTDP-4-amino-4,6-dideoxygalactose transaminase